MQHIAVGARTVKKEKVGEKVVCEKIVRECDIHTHTHTCIHTYRRLKGAQRIKSTNSNSYKLASLVLIFRFVAFAFLLLGIQFAFKTHTTHQQQPSDFKRCVVKCLTVSHVISLQYQQ